MGSRVQLAALDLEPDESSRVPASSLDLEPEQQPSHDLLNTARSALGSAYEASKDFIPSNLLEAGKKAYAGDYPGAVVEATPAGPLLKPLLRAAGGNKPMGERVKDVVSVPMAAAHGVSGDLADEAVAKVRSEDPEQWRRLFEEADKRAPGAHMAGQFAVPMPTKFAGPAAARIAQGAGAGGLLGYLTGFGASEKHGAEAMKEAVPSGLAGLLAGGAAQTAGEIGGAFANKAGAAKQANLDAEKKAALEAVYSASGGLGGEAKASLNNIAKAREAAANPNLPQEVRDEAQAFINSDYAKKLEERAIRNILKSLPYEMAGHDAAEASLAGAQAANIPAAVEARAAERLANKTPVMDRLKKYGIPVAMSAIGGSAGPAGAAVGAGLGIGMGKPNTAMANLLKDPVFRYNTFRGLSGPFQAVGNPLARRAEVGSLAEYLQALHQPEEEESPPLVASH